MARDFARNRKPGSRRKQAPASRKATAAPVSRWRWYTGGLASGVLLSFLVYLVTLPPTPGLPGATGEAGTPDRPSPPKPRFDFYTMLPEQSIAVEATPAEPASTEAAPPGPREFYLLQAGSFRQRDDADRRRAELLLLGLEPRVEEASGDNGRWYRVFLGPFPSRAEMSRARSLTTAQDIDTLLLKRAGP